MAVSGDGTKHSSVSCNSSDVHRVARLWLAPMRSGAEFDRAGLAPGNRGAIECLDPYAQGPTGKSWLSIWPSS